MSFAKDIKKMNDKGKLLLVRDLLDAINIKTKIKRIGDVNMRIDAMGKLPDGKTAIFSIEFGNDALEIPRKILEDYAIIHNRYNIKKKDIVTFAILNLLPSKRSEYYKVVDDIKRITQIEIYTMPLDFLNKMIKRKETINNYNYKDFYISSVEGNKLFKPSK